MRLSFKTPWLALGLTQPSVPRLPGLLSARVKLLRTRADHSPLTSIWCWRHEWVVLGVGYTYLPPVRVLGVHEEKFQPSSVKQRTCGLWSPVWSLLKQNLHVGCSVIQYTSVPVLPLAVSNKLTAPLWRQIGRQDVQGGSNMTGTICV